jgi:amidophosphoribosyltransferase
VVRGKRLVVVDDSIVRGNTQRALVRMLREAGALEVHVRISSPPVKWPCFYGIDFATRAELVANGLEIDGIRRSIGADTLGYVSLDGLVSATEQPKTRLCMACFDGQYPIELPAGNLIGKHVLEGVSRRATMPPATPEVAEAAVAEFEREYEEAEFAAEDRELGKPLVGSPGGADALHRP